jgi:hypothetical protein
MVSIVAWNSWLQPCPEMFAYEDASALPGAQWFDIAQDRAAWCSKIEIK